MKTALVLHGQPRFFEPCYKWFFSTIIDTLKADVFFHTWWSDDMVGSLYPCRPELRSVLNDEDMLVQEDIPVRLLDLYKPVDCLFEDYNSVLKEFKNQSNFNFQYYTQWKSKRLVQKYIASQNISYDLVIRSRFDLMVTQDIKFIVDDNLWVPSCCPYTDGRVNDMFSVSNWDIFDKITDAFFHIKPNSNDERDKMEWPLALQIERHNIPVKKIPASYDSFDILRSETAKQFL